jgi:DNA-binding transcriptional regulator YiaG
MKPWVMPDLSAVREKLKLTQLDVARTIGVHWVTVSKWERGVSRPSAHQIEILTYFARAAKAGYLAPLPAPGVEMLRELLQRGRET